MLQPYMDKVALTPTEFAALFGKERTWAYRMMYAGKIVAVGAEINAVAP